MRLTLLATLLVLKATTGTATTSFNVTYKSEELDDSSDSSDITNLANEDVLHRSLTMKIHHTVQPPFVHPPVHQPVKGPVHPTDKDGVNGHAGAGHPEGNAAGGAAMAAHKKEDDEINKLHAGCHNGMRNGKKDPKCNAEHHVIFIQEWVPALKYTKPKNLCWECSAANQLIEFNKRLMIDDYIPVGSIIAKTATTKINDKDFYIIDQSSWWDQRKGQQVYKEFWEKHGKHTGLTPMEIFKEVQRLQRNHPTPIAISGEDEKKNPNAAAVSKTKEKSFPLQQLRKNLGANSCVECKKNAKGDFLTAVRYCHEVINKHAVAKAVPYTKCGKCPLTCSGNILVPKFEVY